MASPPQISATIKEVEGGIRDLKNAITWKQLALGDSGWDSTDRAYQSLVNDIEQDKVTYASRLARLKELQEAQIQQSTYTASLLNYLFKDWDPDGYL